MAVNQHMVGVELPLLNPDYNRSEFQNGHINGYYEPQRNSEHCLYINSDYIYKITLNSTQKLNKDDEYDHHRIIIIEGFNSYEDGLKCVINQEFVDFIQSCPFVFVIIAKCKYPSFNERRNISRLLKKSYRTKLPLIVSFESDIPKIFYKNHGKYSPFIEYETGLCEDEPIVTDFGTMLMNFEVNGLGYFDGCFDRISINNLEDAQKLMDIFAGKKDLLGIRFLNLFSASIRPDINHIRDILADDCKNLELDGFCAIFDFNIEDHGSRNLIASNGRAINGNDIHLILSSTLANQDNILMVAIRCRNKNAVKLLINCGINLNLSNGPDTHEIAADIAYKTNQYDLLFLLLEANSRFPHDFESRLFDNFTNDLKSFINQTCRLHELITNIDDNERVEELSKVNLEEIRDIIQSRRHLDYWYDQSNESAATKAIKLKKFRTYNFLLRNGLFVGPFEDINAIKATLSESEQDQIRDINANNAQKLPNDYLLILQLNSFIWKNKKDEDMPSDLIEMTYNILDRNEDIRPILKIVAEAKIFRIIFDFNHTSVEALDFTSRSRTCAVFHLRQSHIYIGAKDLRDESRKYETIATLAHELCHFAILLTYNNLCNPYVKFDEIRKRRFQEISEECKKLQDNENYKEYLVGLVYKYDSVRQHAELIVRAPHMIMHYIKQQEKLSTLKNIYNNLFCFYELSVLPDIKNKINNVSQQFAENLKFEHEFWEKKKRKQKIIKFSLVLAIILAVMLGGVSTILMMFFEPCIVFDTTCHWDGLRMKTKERILDTDLEFNNHLVKLRHITNEDPHILQHLSSDQIKIASKFSINKQDLALPFRYYERQITKFDEGYYYNASNCSYIYTSKYNITQLEILINLRKIYLISDEPVAGKSTLFKEIASRKRNEIGSKWVAYLNLKEFDTQNYTKLSTWTSTNLTNFLIEVHNLERLKFQNLTSIEIEIFKKKFASGDVVLFIDHIDWIFMNNENLGEKFLRILIEKSHNSTELWFATRNWFGEKIEKIIQNYDSEFVGRHKLLPLFCENRDKFLKSELQDKNLIKDELNKVQLRMQEILSFTEKWRNWQKVHVDNICLLQIIMSHSIKSIKSNEINYNFFNILDEFVVKLMALRNEKSEQTMKDERLPHDMTFMAVALRFLEINYIDSLELVNMSKLIKEELARIAPHKNSEYFTVYGSNGTWDLTSSRIQKELKKGILKYENGQISFLHVTIFEYYVAFYIRERLWLPFSQTGEIDEFLLLLFNIFKDKLTRFPVVQKCIIDAVKEHQLGNGTVIKEFDEKFREKFVKLYDEFVKTTNINVGSYLKPVFEDSEKMKELIDSRWKIQVENYKRYIEELKSNQTNFITASDFE